MDKKTLIYINGGASLLSSGTGINAVTRLFQFILDLGNVVGSAIRRRIDGTYCK